MIRNQPTASAPLPLWVRCASIAWLAVWIPSYARYWGWANFLHVCDVVVLLTCLGLLLNSRLLLSSQALASMLPDFFWSLDAGWRWVTGKHLVGGTEYMWDATVPLWVRLLSLFHVLWPLILLAALRRTRYDRRGFALQCGVFAVLLVISRFLGPADNLNNAFLDPVWHRSFGPAPLHLAVIFLGHAVLFYVPTHSFLAKVFPSR